MVVFLKEHKPVMAEKGLNVRPPGLLPVKRARGQLVSPAVPLRPHAGPQLCGAVSSARAVLVATVAVFSELTLAVGAVQRRQASSSAMAPRPSCEHPPTSQAPWPLGGAWF